MRMFFNHISFTEIQIEITYITYDLSLICLYIVHKTYKYESVLFSAFLDPYNCNFHTVNVISLCVVQQ